MNQKINNYQNEGDTIKNDFLKGATLLTISSYLIKILGFIYIIPFVAMVGQENYVLFEYAYKPYSIMIMIATLGIPNAISKYVAKSRENEEFEKVSFVLYSGLLVMFVMGLLSFFILYTNADKLASVLVGAGDNGNSLSDVTFVIQMVSYALIAVPVLALLRGFFQGHQLMKPTAVSKVLEQVSRITIVLVGTYIIIYQFDIQPIVAIGVSTFAAFIASLAGIIIMIFYFKKQAFNITTKLPKFKASFRRRDVLKEIGRYMIPFILTGAAIPLFQAIDTFSLNGSLVDKGFSLAEAENLNAVLSLIQKIIIIPAVIATSLSTSLVAYISKDYFGGRIQDIRNNIIKSIEIVLFFVLPSSIAFMIISKPIYTALFGLANADAGGNLLAWFSLMPLFYSFYSVTTAIMQGMDKTKTIFSSLICGFIVKILAVKPLILMFDELGTAFSTYIGLSIPIIIQMLAIQKNARFNWGENLLQHRYIVSQAVTMGIILMPIGFLSLNLDHYVYQLLMMIGGVFIGAFIYLFIAYKNGSLNNVLPQRTGKN